MILVADLSRALKIQPGGTAVQDCRVSSEIHIKRRGQQYGYINHRDPASRGRAEEQAGVRPAIGPPQNRPDGRLVRHRDVD